MAGKKAKKSSKTLGKKSMKKTKGGILIGLNQPTLSTNFVKIETNSTNTNTTNLDGGLNIWKF
ncbi:MAG TPA: hypothetical protein VF950_30215 [Planctomycetota bacterium]